MGGSVEYPESPELARGSSDVLDGDVITWSLSFSELDIFLRLVDGDDLSALSGDVSFLVLFRDPLITRWDDDVDVDG